MANLGNWTLGLGLDLESLDSGKKEFSSTLQGDAFNYEKVVAETFFFPVSSGLGWAGLHPLIS